MATAQTDPLLIDVAIYLGATVVAVPLFKHLGLGSILGYLAAGVLLGPWGFDLLGDVEQVRHVAEFGVVLLLFVIGLELRPSRLWRLRSEIFGLGLTQVLLTGLVLAALLRLIGFHWPAASVIGLALALSSTAFGVQILRDAGALKTPYGDRAFSILLFQDIAVVPLLALTALLGGGGGEVTLGDVVVALLALAGIGVVGHFGLPRLFRVIAVIKANEVFAATALLIVAMAALAMQWAGLSMALGAFLAGVLLAETEFRHQLESDIEPFRTLFLGLFFVGVGMAVDWGAALGLWWAVIFGAILLFAAKMAALTLLARVAGSPEDDALRIAATLGQAGEFGFVVFSLAAGDGLIGRAEEAALTAAVALSMAMTPFAAMGVERWLEKQREKAEAAGELPAVEEAEAASIIIAGFGRTGQVIARVMRLRGYSVTLIDNSPRRIRLARGFGSEVYYGDATKIDVLAAAGADEAEAIFFCVNDREGARQAVQRVNQRFPNLKTFFSTYDRFSQLELFEAGATHVKRETHESAVTLARMGLAELGDEAIADEIIEEYRRQDQELMRLQIEYGLEEGAEMMRRRYSME